MNFLRWAAETFPRSGGFPTALFRQMMMDVGCSHGQAARSTLTCSPLIRFIAVSWDLENRYRV
jgi:hypothetical protein